MEGTDKRDHVSVVGVSVNMIMSSLVPQKKECLVWLSSCQLKKIGRPPWSKQFQVESK